MEIKQKVGLVLAAGVAFIVIKGMMNDASTPRATKAPASVASYTPSAEVLPESSISYAQLNAEIGCKSTYSDQKKSDIFNASYKNHWMTWKGEIALLESDEVSLNIDGVGTQDLQVDFADKNAGYDLSKGSQLKVRFLMKTAGGCFLPFGGEQAVIVR